MATAEFSIFAGTLMCDEERISILVMRYLGFSGASVVKNPPDLGLTPGLEIFPGGGNSNPLP